MKKIVCLLLALVMVMGLMAGCSDAGSTASVQSSAAEVASAPAQEAPAAEAPAEEASAGEVETSPEDIVPVETDEPAHVMPLTEEEIELSLFTGMNPNLMGVIETYAEAGIFAWMEEQTGIKVNIPAIHPASQQEEWTLMAAAGDYTDFLGEVGSYPGGTQGAIDDEVVYDLNDMKEYMPLYFGLMESDDEIRKNVTLDSGAIAATYRIISNPDFYRYTNGPMVRSDWLEELGLETPETFDEYYDVLTAFKNEYGATMWFSANESPIFSLAYGIRVGYTFGMGSSLDCFYLDGDTVVCGFLQDEFKDYLTLMQKWYSEGLLNPDFATVTSRFVSGMSDEFSAVLNGDHGIFVEEAPVFASYAAYDNFEMAPIPVPRLTEGQVLNVTSQHYTRVDGLKFGLATTCEYPELAAEWLDYWYSEEATVVCNWGTEGESFEYDEDGNPYFTDLIMNNPDGLAMSFARELYTAPTGGYLYDHGTQYALWGDLEYEAAELWAQNCDDTTTLPSFMSLTTDEKEEYSSYSGDIITYVSENLSKLIMCELNLEEDLDTFVATIKEMGIERCIELQQIAYDRYLER